MPEFLSLTELSQLYGVSRNTVGQWLVEIGLRTDKKRPSKRAFDGGYVEQRPSSQPATYFWVWHGKKTIQILDASGHVRVEPIHHEV